ncbi:MAG: hypothetical protein AB8F95_08290, partial [Bacteroidia bacterium]
MKNAQYQISAAGNTLAPLYFLLKEKGYILTKKDNKLIAENEKARLVAEDLLTLGGLVLLFENKGKNWRVDDD